MARHGYLGDDYGSGFDPSYDDDRDDDRERSWRGDRDEGGRGIGGWGTSRDRQRWGDDDRGGRDRFMFGDRDRSWADRERPRSQGSDDDRGFFSRVREEGRSWFSDDDDDDNRSRGRSDRSEWFGGRTSSQGQSHYGREHGQGGFQGDYGGGRQQGGFGGRGDWGGQGGRQSFSSHPDHHYLSWREKQLQALDRDYQDYCREREQQFHSDFDSWRQSRQTQSGQTSQTGQAQGSSETGNPGGSDELLLDRSSGGTLGASNEPMSTVDAQSGATLGEAPESGGGRRR